MPVSQDNAGGPIPSRYTERGSRSRIMTNECQDRVDSCQKSVCKNSNTFLHTRSRPICILTEPSNILVCSTSSRRGENGARCVHLGLELWTSFIHPSMVLLNRILLKICQNKATAPAWVRQPWYPSLLEMLVDLPAKLPTSEKTIFLPFD